MSEKRHANLGIHHTDRAPVRRGPIMRKMRVLSLVACAVLLVGGALRWIDQSVHARNLAAATETGNVLHVRTVVPQRSEDSKNLMLPGTLQGKNETTLYARTGGYLKRWTRDIGAQVKRGDVLAEIDAPELDDQLRQAQAAAEQARSSLELARTSADRWEALRKKDAVTQQEANERTSGATQAKANYDAAVANVERLRKLVQFKQIVAPISGVVTRRNVETGDLIDAGNGGAAKALFSIAQVDTLRMYVYVPQSLAAAVHVGDAVSVMINEARGQKFPAKVAHTAGAIDPATRTMQVDIEIPNADGKLLAGAYATASLPLRNTAAPLVVPTNVLLFRAEGTMAACVDAHGKVRLQKLVLGNDLGNTVVVLEGLKADDQLVLNPPDSLADGDTVTIAPAAEAKPNADNKSKS